MKYYTAKLYRINEETFDENAVSHQFNFGKPSKRKDLGVYLFTKEKDGYRELLTGRVFGVYRMVMDPISQIGYLYEKAPKTSIFLDHEDIRQIDPEVVASWVTKYQSELKAEELDELFDSSTIPLKNPKEPIPSFGPSVKK